VQYYQLRNAAAKESKLLYLLRQVSEIRLDFLADIGTYFLSSVSKLVSGWMWAI
jgi:hypothetical protein